MNTDKLTRTANKLWLKTKKNSPEILLGVGIVSGVAAVVFACKATRKVDKIIEQRNTDLALIEDCAKVGTIIDDGKEVPYTEEDAKKDIAITYAKSVWEFAKIYAVPVGLGAASITALLASHGIIKKRNVALNAAYTGLFQSFSHYREGVIEKFGEQVDKEIHYGLKTVETEEVTVDEKGKERKNKNSVLVADGDLGCSIYAKFYDETCCGWDPDPELSRMFLNDRCRDANRLLRKNGVLFLNEVYDMLGIKRTQAGQTVGWHYDPEDPNCDNFVDFGVYSTKRANQRFVNGLEDVILLDFNVEGNVSEYI